VRARESPHELRPNLEHSWVTRPDDLSVLELLCLPEQETTKGLITVKCAYMHELQFNNLQCAAVMLLALDAREASIWAAGLPSVCAGIIIT
jgi:hypothetical protein